MDAAESDPRHTPETLNEEISAISASMPQSPMDAVADPRDTSKTLSAAHSANAEVLRSPVNAVADPGDNVRNVVADPSAETSIAPGEGSVNGNRVENSVETVKSAAETAADGTDGGNSPMWETYGMEAPKTEGQMEDVKTFDQALELAGTGSGMAANVNYVLGNL